MSKVKIQGNASGTGVVTLTAPNTNTDRTITLPDSTGSILDSTSTLDATKLSGALPAIDGSALTGMPAAGANTSLSNLSSTGEQRVCQAWVAFQAPSGVVSIKGQFNVSSVSDNGVGQYRVNFATAMPNANYTTVVSMSADTAVTWGGRPILNHIAPDSSSPSTTTSVSMLAGPAGSFDPDYTNVVIHGN